MNEKLLQEMLEWFDERFVAEFCNRPEVDQAEAGLNSREMAAVAAYKEMLGESSVLLSNREIEFARLLDAARR